jgi:cytochrome P450
MDLSAQFDPNSPALWLDPYPTYARFLENDPVHWGIAPNAELQGSWYVFGFADSQGVLADATTFASDPGAVGMENELPTAWTPVANVFQKFLGGIDGPEHHRLRSTMMKAFTPKRVAQLGERVNEITLSLLDEAMSTPSGRFDAVADVAFQLPMTVIGDLMGVPSDDRVMFRDLSTSIASAIDDPSNLERAQRGAEAVFKMSNYFGELLEERRSRPADDLLTSMAQATGDDGASIAEEYLCAIAVELIVAGHETTVNALTIGLVGFSEQSECVPVMGDVTGRDLDNAVDEMLRWTSPSQRQRNRWATCDTKIGGKAIKRGDSVVVVTGSANRDSLVYREPNQIDFSRPTNRSLVFGFGTHFCLGAALARLELRVAYPALAHRFSSFRIPPRREIEWRENSLLPGPAELWIEV